jgi:hypothetical protein
MNYNIISVILLVIVIGLLTRMYQTKEYFETMSRLEKGKKICNSQNFKPWTLTFPDDIIVREILTTILSYLNKKLDVNYHLGKIDHVTKETDFDGNTRYLIDFFCFQLDSTKKNDINRRFIVDVTKKINNSLKVNMITVGNAKKYKHPHEMLLPENEDELILKDTNVQSIHHIVGKINPILDYGINPSKIDLRHLSDIKHNYQSWILPKNSHLKTDVFPCRKQHKWWDINGVHHTDNASQKCIGLDTAANNRPIIPEFEAGHARLITDKNSYTWLFDKARGRQSSTEPASGPTPIL